MKKILIIVVALFINLTSFSQEQKNDSISDIYKNANEIKLNGLMLLVGAFEVAYERNLTEESSVGISFFVPYDTEDLDADINYYISPYFRFFFGEKYAAGFFVEGFGMLNSIDREVSSINTQGIVTNSEKAVTDFALGFGLGGKWVTESGFVFEVVGGIGRNLFENISNDSNIVGKFGFNLGYRF